jgi:hypothetical protein
MNRPIDRFDQGLRREAGQSKGQWSPYIGEEATRSVPYLNGSSS